MQAFVILLCGVALTLLHLVPLPPFMWMSLPGREFVVEGLQAAGAEIGWMPLSLSPPATQLAFLTLLVPIAGFVASLSLSSEDRWRIVGVILFCVLASALLGLAQKFQGPQSSLYIYEDTNRGSAVGFFGNRNFFAALLYCSIPLTWALALHIIRQGRIRPYIVGLFAALFLLVTILVLAAVGSRAGILLSMLALLASASIGWGVSTPGFRTGQSSRWTIIAIIVAALLIGQFGMVGILRFAALDPVSDYRTLMSEVTLRAAWQFFPFGSGFGTFVPIYAMFETPSTILTRPVNHAHNDWAEVWLEGGLPVALVALAFLAWYGACLYRLWRPHQETVLLPRAAAIICGLLLIHSFVDYPLREPALAAIFGLMCGFMAALPPRFGIQEPLSRSRHHKSAKHRAHLARDERGRR